VHQTVLVITKWKSHAQVGFAFKAKYRVDGYVIGWWPKAFLPVNSEEDDSALMLLSGHSCPLDSCRNTSDDATDGWRWTTGVQIVGPRIDGDCRPYGPTCQSKRAHSLPIEDGVGLVLHRLQSRLAFMSSHIKREIG